MFFSYGALTNVVSDVLIALVPFPFLFHLGMSTSKKLAISGMLLTAAVYVIRRYRAPPTTLLIRHRVVIAGIGRTIAFFTVGHSLDYTCRQISISTIIQPD